MKGVIVPVSVNATWASVDELTRRLDERFPGVRFAVIAGATASAVFDFDPDPDETTDRKARK